MITTLLAGLVLAVPSVTADPAFPAMDSCYVVTTGSSIGAGFLVAPDLVVTAAHVVEGADTVSLESGAATPERLRGMVIHRDEVEDIAVIQLASSPSVPVLDLSDEIPVRGEVVYAVGSPIGQLVASRGVVVESGPAGIEATTPVDPGSSGGPLLAQDGSVLGVVVAESRLTGNSVATTSAAIERVLVDAESVPVDVVTETPTRQPTGLPTWVAILIPLTFITAVAALLVSLLTLHRSRLRERNRIVITLDEE
jgi:S1-C subfamily serine protease